MLGPKKDEYITTAHLHLEVHVETEPSRDGTRVNEGRLNPERAGICVGEWE